MFLFITNLLFASPESPYEQGVVHMTNKNFSDAITDFDQCIKEKPEQIECHWEIGWAHWMLSDWNAVVKHWSIVETTQPEFPKLNGYLIQAKDNQKLQQIMTESQKSAPASFASAVSEGANRIAIWRYDDWYQFSSWILTKK